jgi:multicomponent K+:H+ antiporter subunit A
MVLWKWAAGLKRFFGTERLQPQLFLLVGVAVIAGAWPLFGTPGPRSLSGNIEPAFALVWGVGVVCAIAAAHQAKFHRLVSLILLGGAGLVTCITFVWFSAPDLAVTQLLVEIVTTVLILLGLRWLPKRSPQMQDRSEIFRARLRRSRDMVLALIAGGGMTIIAWEVMTRQRPEGISSYFLENAYKLGGGTNVVNVMLVDFRGLDTLGEITVLGVVALTVFALLRRFRPAPDSIAKPRQQQIQEAHAERRPDRKPEDAVDEYLRIPALIMRWMFPAAIVLAVHIFLRGHDKPGGGFAAGIVMSIAFILQYIAGGTRWVEDRLRILPVVWVSAGLLLALGTGLVSWLFGYPFLTSAFQYAEVPAIGRVPLASALIFDLGVFVLVVGATVLILIALAHQSVRKPRPALPVKSGDVEDRALRTPGGSV